MATKKKTMMQYMMSRVNPTPPTVGPFAKPSTANSVESTSARFKSEPNYNYTDAKKRNPNGSIKDEMNKKREGFQKSYAKGEMTKSQLRDSVQTTLDPKFGSSKYAKAKTKEMIGGKSTNKAYNGKAAKKAATTGKGCVGKAGPGVNMCKPPKGSNGKSTIF